MMEPVLHFIDFPFHRCNKSFIRRHRSIFSDGDGGRLRDGAGRRAGTICAVRHLGARSWGAAAGGGSVDTRLGGQSRPRVGSREAARALESQES